MPYMNLWGINPLTQLPSSYISHVQHSEREAWEHKATTEGWTHLTWGIWGDHLNGQAPAKIPQQTKTAKNQQARKPKVLPAQRRLEARAK